MPVAKITGQGLFVIALSVALLWGCIVGERLTLRSAARERVRVLREIEQLRRKSRPTPVVAPMPARARRSTISLG